MISHSVCTLFFFACDVSPCSWRGGRGLYPRHSVHGGGGYGLQGRGRGKLGSGGLN